MQLIMLFLSMFAFSVQQSLFGDNEGTKAVKKCRRKDCALPRRGSQFCSDHECAFEGCSNGPKKDGVLCGPHEDKAYREMGESMVEDDYGDDRATLPVDAGTHSLTPGGEVVDSGDESACFALFGITLASLLALPRKNGTKFRFGGGGSRKLKLADQDEKNRVARPLRALVRELKEALGDDLTIVSAAAEGFDELLAWIAILEDVRLVLTVPNKGYFDYYWVKKSLTKTDRTADVTKLKDNAARIFYVKEDVHGITDAGVYLDVVNKKASWKPGKDLVHANYVRNDHNVELCDAMVFYGAADGGTKDCMEKAKAAGVLAGIV